ncbi:hypothetical protein ANRL4_00966 [Anaerolineae bacterium]|nr:hypothetical protein ANRL4_00966 [Anaerolineae bacterium]
MVRLLIAFAKSGEGTHLKTKGEIEVHQTAVRLTACGITRGVGQKAKAVRGCNGIVNPISGHISGSGKRMWQNHQVPDQPRKEGLIGTVSGCLYWKTTTGTRVMVSGVKVV